PLARRSRAPWHPISFVGPRAVVAAHARPLADGRLLVAANRHRHDRPHGALRDAAIHGTRRTAADRARRLWPRCANAFAGRPSLTPRLTIGYALLLMLSLHHRAHHHHCPWSPPAELRVI